MISVLASSASAVVVHSRGQFVGVAPRPGIAPATIPGAVAAAGSAATPTASTTSSTSDNLTYQGGPVLHSSDPYLIFWAPSGESIPAPWQTLMGRYFSDLAADSTKATNVYAVARQFTDGTGFADYRQTFDPAHQVPQDTNPYPSPDGANAAPAGTRPASPTISCSRRSRP